MRKHIIIIVIGMGLLLSGCSLSHSYGKSQVEIEQYENPMIWKEVLQIQVTLWPLEKKVTELEKKVNEIEKKANKTEKNVIEIEKNMDKIRDELATTKLSSMQANKNIESLQAELQQIKSESIQKEKTSVPLPVGIKKKKETLKTETTEAAGENKKAGPDIKSTIITDIKYLKVTDTQDKVLIYVNAMNNPKRQTLIGENPRIVLDFLNTRTIEKENYEINTGGNLIKRVRIRSYREPMQKVRVVFDMVPNKKYSVDHKFSKTEKVHSFDITLNP